MDSLLKESYNTIYLSPIDVKTTINHPKNTFFRALKRLYTIISFLLLKFYRAVIKLSILKITEYLNTLAY